MSRKIHKSTNVFNQNFEKVVSELKARKMKEEHKKLTEKKK